MDSHEIFNLANILDRATLEGREIERLTLSHSSLTLDEAYQIQDVGIAQRTSRSEKVIGFKLGLTSKAKQLQMDLHSPIYGVLTDRMKIEDGSTFSLKGTIHPKIEPEIAFQIGRDIRGPINFNEALDACSAVYAAMEILDSRYLNFKYFSLPDVVADNCSSSYFVLSQASKDLRSIDLSHLEMRMEVNGSLAQQGVSSDISGHPLNSVVQLSEMLHSRSRILPAGSIVLAGAATQARALEPGIQVRLTVEKLGSVEISVGP